MSDHLPPADAILAVDIGNSRIGLGLSNADGLHGVRRVPVTAPEQWREAIYEVWSLAEKAESKAIVVASVNPRIAAEFTEMLEAVCEVTPLRIRDDVPLPLAFKLDGGSPSENPLPRREGAGGGYEDEIGVDRICSAAAAFELVGGACAVASFGTAITIDCVSQAGEFLGGAILPGLDMAAEALHENTAALPRIAPHAPTGAFGRDTEDAINNGIVYGAVGAMREIVERFATALGQWPPLVLTGGNSNLIRELADFADAHDPNLCLRGITLAYQKAAR